MGAQTHHSLAGPRGSHIGGFIAGLGLGVAIVPMLATIFGLETRPGAVD